MNPAPRTVEEKVRALAKDLRIRLDGQAAGERIQFAIPSCCHVSSKKSLTIGTHGPDGVPSEDGYPLVTCRVGCDYATIRDALIRQGARPDRFRPTSGNSRPARRSTAARARRTEQPTGPVPVVPHAVWLRWHDALLRNPTQLTYLRQEKGIREDTVRAMCLGWNGQRIAIPIFDQDARCVNIRLYLPHARKGASKIISYWQRGGPSYGRNRLFVPGEHLDPARTTLHCAGELDAILGWQHGWQTSTQTGGEASRFPALDVDWMRGQQVVVAYDNDDAGRQGATTTARDLASIARSVRVADLGAFDLPDKGDLGDVWRRDDLGELAVRTVVSEATPWAASA